MTSIIYLGESFFTPAQVTSFAFACMRMWICGGWASVFACFVRALALFICLFLSSPPLFDHFTCGRAFVFRLFGFRFSSRQTNIQIHTDSQNRKILHYFCPNIGLVCELRSGKHHIFGIWNCCLCHESLSSRNTFVVFTLLAQTYFDAWNCIFSPSILKCSIAQQKIDKLIIFDMLFTIVWIIFTNSITIFI